MYKPVEWKDRLVERPRTFNTTSNPDGSITFTPAPGTVLEEGTAVNAGNMNPISQTLFDVYAQIPYLTNAETQLIYDNGNLIRVDETVSAILRRRTTLNYTGADLASVNVKIYDADGVTILEDFTDTLRYDNGALVSVIRTVA